MEFDIESIIIALGYVGIFLLMISNGVITFPSSQVLYIITGYFISTGDLSLALVVFFGALGNTVGNIILYEIVRFKGLHYIEKWKIFPPQDLKKITVALHKKGVWFLFIGKLLPALKVFVPIAAAVGKTERKIYIPMMLVASAIWTAPFIAIGYYFGKSSDLFGKYAVAVLIVAFIVMGLFYKYINSKEVLEEVRN
jgi:membrane protein DedA with SNARE-associated domain